MYAIRSYYAATGITTRVVLATWGSTTWTDQADLGGHESSFQNGQSSVSGSVLGVSDPDIESEYVRATFRYIPYRSEQAVGDVIVAGSFNRWVLDAANRLRITSYNVCYTKLLRIGPGR